MQLHFMQLQSTWSKIAETNLKQIAEQMLLLSVVLRCLEWYNMNYANTISKEQHGHRKRKGKN